MKRCVIIGGAPIERYEEIRTYLRADDHMIFCDGGLRHAERLGISPDLIVGDFDSHERPDTKAETIVLPTEKDDTDAMFAVKEALGRGFEEFLLVGAFGGRLDHSFGNLSLLLMLDSLGKKAMAVDDYGELEIVSSSPAYVGEGFKCFSVLNVSGTAEGICIENAKYPLRDAVIGCEYQYGISNEVLGGKTAKVTVASGRLLLMRIRRG